MEKELFIKMVLDTWNTKLNGLDKLFAELSDEQLKKQIAPGKNTGVYLLGHMIAINNKMVPLLGLGEELNPDLYKTFVDTADMDIVERPSITVLRQEWKKINEELGNKFAQVQPDEWFQKHNSVSEQDFAKEPHRNKLNVIINRTNHLEYHAGQVVLLKI